MPIRLCNVIVFTASYIISYLYYYFKTFFKFHKNYTLSGKKQDVFRIRKIGADAFAASAPLLSLILVGALGFFHSVRTPDLGFTDTSGKVPLNDCHYLIKSLAAYSTDMAQIFTELFAVNADTGGCAALHFKLAVKILISMDYILSPVIAKTLYRFVYILGKVLIEIRVLICHFRHLRSVPGRTFSVFVIIILFFMLLLYQYCNELSRIFFGIVSGQ